MPDYKYCPLKPQNWRCTTQITTLQMTAERSFSHWRPPTFRRWTQYTLLVCRAVCEIATSVSRCLSSTPACWHTQSKHSSGFGWSLLRRNGHKFWICCAWDLLPALGGVILHNLWQGRRIRMIIVCQQGFKNTEVSKIWLVMHTGFLSALWSGKAQTLYFQLSASSLRLLVTLAWYCTRGVDRQGRAAKSLSCTRCTELGKLASGLTSTWLCYHSSGTMIPALPAPGLGSWQLPANRKGRFLTFVLAGIFTWTTAFVLSFCESETLFTFIV